MSGTGGMELESFGQDAIRMAHRLFVPAPTPAHLPALDDLLTDPAECLNALFAPLTPFMHKTAASSPQPPESTAEPSRDAPPIRLRTRQAERDDAKTVDSPGVTGWTDLLPSAPSGTRTAFPKHTTSLPKHTPGTTQSENFALPDALDALRKLTTMARTVLTLPLAKGNNGANNSEICAASVPAASEIAAPRSPGASPLSAVRNANENAHKHDTRLPFLSAPLQGADGPLSRLQKNAEQNGNRQDNRQIATPATTGQAGAETVPAPLRLMRGASPLAAMLQAHVHTPPFGTDHLPAPSHVTVWPESQTDTPPGPFQPALAAPRVASAIHELALTPQDTPNNVPQPLAPPDMEAMIQVLEAHLKLEFLRAYGTSGR